MKESRSTQRPSVRRDDSAIDAGAVFRALGDSTRLRILERLAEGEECVCTLAEDVETSQPLLSFHLRVLREARLVKSRRDGRWIHYSINKEEIEAIEGYFSNLREPRGVPRAVKRCRD